MTVILDKYGRILLPKKLRDALGLKEQMTLSLRQEGNQVIIEPVKEDALYVEKNGFLVYTGKCDANMSDRIKEERRMRDDQLFDK